MRETTLALTLVLVSAAGCRSDGGLDREDCSHGMAFSTRIMGQHARDDWDSTRKALASAPHEFVASFPKAARTMSDTWRLYLESQKSK